jgi:MFS family permease
MELGAFFGYVSFGFFADRFGRRPVFLIFVLTAALIIPIYGNVRNEFLILALGPFLGFFGHGYFSLFGSMLAEIFPTSIRATAQGFCYNSGKALSAFAPMFIGYLADRFGIGAALGAASMFLVMAAGLIFLLPETSGAELE